MDCFNSIFLLLVLSKVSNSNTLSFIYYLIWYQNYHIILVSLFYIVCWYLLRDNLIKDWPFLWYFLSILNVFWAILFCFYYINLILILDIGFQQHILFQEYQCFSWEYVLELYVFVFRNKILML